MFDPKQLKLLANYEHSGILFALGYDSRRRVLYGAGTDWAVYSVDLQAKEPAAKKRWTHHDNYVSSLIWLDGTIISAGFDRRIIWCDTASGQMLRAIDGAHDGWVRALAVFPDGERIVSVGDDMLAKIWDRHSGRLIRTLEGHAKLTPQRFATALYAVAVSPDGRTLATADRVGDVCVWDADSGLLVHRLHAPTFYTYDRVKRDRSLGGIRSLAFSPVDGLLALGGIGVVTNVDGFVGPCRVEVWNWRSNKRVFTGQSDHKAVLNQVSFHPTESWLIAAGGGDSGGLVAFWDQTELAPQHTVKDPAHVQSFVLGPDGRHLFTAGADGFHVYGPPPTPAASQEAIPAPSASQ